MIRAIFSVAAALLLAAPAATAADPGPAVSAPYFGIRVVDSETGRGVPLVELRTVNRMRFASPG